MKPGCIGKSNTNHLPIPTYLNENPYGKKTFFEDMVFLILGGKVVAGLK
jgi:hypothetical protein